MICHRCRRSSATDPGSAAPSALTSVREHHFQACFFHGLTRVCGGAIERALDLSLQKRHGAGPGASRGQTLIIHSPSMTALRSATLVLLLFIYGACGGGSPAVTAPTSVPGAPSP